MGILTRIVKVMVALLTSNVVNLITKLLLPPIFLYIYGTTLYGEWLALSGAVAYLSTLNFGIQTYITQDLTVRYQRNDLERYHLQQSTSLRVLLGILGTAAVVCLVVFTLPVQNWLRLTLSQRVTERDHHVEGHRIHALGPVERHDGDGGVGPGDFGEGHARHRTTHRLSGLFG